MKKLIIMGGLPASGKSTIRQEFYSEYDVVDCDELKKIIEGCDPTNPREFHAQSKVLEKALIYKYLSEGKSFLYDTTATNSDKVIRMTQQAQELGYEVEMVYVKVTLATSIERNSKRDRVVPMEVIIEKYEQIESAMKIAEKFVDTFTVIDNEADWLSLK